MEHEITIPNLLAKIGEKQLVIETQGAYIAQLEAANVALQVRLDHIQSPADPEGIPEPEGNAPDS